MCVCVHVGIACVGKCARGLIAPLTPHADEQLSQMFADVTPPFSAIERIGLTANGNLQRILCSLHDTRVAVEARALFPHPFSYLAPLPPSSPPPPPRFSPPHSSFSSSSFFFLLLFFLLLILLFLLLFSSQQKQRFNTKLGARWVMLALVLP